MLVAIEYYGMNLKEFLLNSRALNYYPSYATNEQRFSLPDSLLIRDCILKKS